MKYMIRLCFFAAATGLSAGVAFAGCVENGTTQRVFFTIEARDEGSRRADWLEPGATLCLQAAGNIIFTAFEAETSVEGCPRLSGPDGQDTLVHFLPTDSCRWASHGD